MTDFSFLDADVRRQHEIARAALDAAKKIQAGKANLDDAKKALLKVASELAANVMATTTEATAKLMDRL